MKPFTFYLAALLVAAGASRASGQSLAGLASQEEARRKAIDNPARVYTNADLTGANPLAAPRPAPAPPAVAGSEDKESQTAKSAAPAPGAPQAAAADEDQQEAVVRDEAWWRARMVKLQQDIDRTKTYVDALQSRINALTTDFVNRDDPYQRAVIESDRLKAMAEFERLKGELEQQNKAVTDLQEEARRAAVPPGWLR
jgi:hypothetical protein